MGGEGVQYQLQGVIYDMGNATMSGEVMYGWIERPDTPIVGMKELLAGLNIERFCWSSKGLGESAISFYIGCLLVSVGQALMASSLHGERTCLCVAPGDCWSYVSICTLPATVSALAPPSLVLR